MEINENYDPITHALRVNNLLNEKIGEGVEPSWNEILDQWNVMCKFPMPRTFMYIMDIKKDKAVISKGFRYLGYPDNWRFTSQEFLALFHVNQLKMITYQTLCLYEIFLNHPTLIKGKETLYSTSRGIKDARGDYKLVHQIAYPVHYDKNGFITKYLSCYRILGDYKGEALETKIYTNAKFANEQKKLNNLMDKVKLNLFSALGFNLNQREIIKLMALQPIPPSSAEIIKTLDLPSKRALDGHRYRLLNHAKEVFPLNNFKTAQDVVDYLLLQHII